MAKQVSSTYGDALFELAVEENQVEELLEEVQAVRVALQDNDELLKLMNHPKIVKEEKVKLMENIFKDRVRNDLVGILTLMVKNDRQNDLIHVLEYVIGRIKEYKNIGIAYVTSAVSLTETQRQHVEQRLLETTKYETMEMNYNVDNTIIGGLIIRIQDHVVDSSIRRQLEAMSKTLLQS